MWSFSPLSILSFPFPPSPSSPLNSPSFTFIAPYHHHISLKIAFLRWVLMTHFCNPSYSRGRNQEDLGLKQPRQIVCEIQFQKKHITKKSWWSGSKCRPWVQAPELKIKKFCFASGSCCDVPGWPATGYVTQLSSTWGLPALASRMLGLQVCPTTPSLKRFKLLHLSMQSPKIVLCSWCIKYESKFFF
jgi:hypothetical protein